MTANMTAQATKERILRTARQLFNQEGYATLSAVDIAHAIDISPGNLYYHYKGKAVIAAVLIEQHLEEIEQIDRTARRDMTESGATLERLWLHVQIMLEEIDDVSFLWRESAVLSVSEPALSPLISRACGALDRFAQAMIDALVTAGTLGLSPEARDGVIGQLAMALAFQLTWLDLAPGGGQVIPEKARPRARLERAAALVLLPLTGFSGQTISD